MMGVVEKTTEEVVIMTGMIFVAMATVGMIAGIEGTEMYAEIVVIEYLDTVAKICTTAVTVAMIEGEIWVVMVIAAMEEAVEKETDLIQTELHGVDTSAMTTVEIAVVQDSKIDQVVEAGLILGIEVTRGLRGIAEIERAVGDEDQVL